VHLREAVRSRDSLWLAPRTRRVGPASLLLDVFELLLGVVHFLAAGAAFVVSAGFSSAAGPSSVLALPTIETLSFFGKLSLLKTLDWACRRVPCETGVRSRPATARRTLRVRAMTSEPGWGQEREYARETARSLHAGTPDWPGSSEEPPIPAKKPVAEKGRYQRHAPEKNSKRHLITAVDQLR